MLLYNYLTMFTYIVGVHARCVEGVVHVQGHRLQGWGLFYFIVLVLLLGVTNADRIINATTLAIKFYMYNYMPLADSGSLRLQGLLRMHHQLASLQNDWEKSGLLHGQLHVLRSDSGNLYVL